LNDFVRCETRGAVTTITLNRPDCGNLITNEMGGVIAGMLDAVTDSHVVVLKGEGADFCLGRDWRPPGGGPPTALDVRANNTEPALSFYAAFRRLTVPVVGVVRGGAIGLGCALAGLCDVTYASDDSRYQLPEMEHDIPPCLAMSALIPRVPLKPLMHLVYDTQLISADDALRIGIVSKLVPAGELDAATDDFVQRLTTRNRPSVLAVKEYLRSAPRMEPQAAADFGSNLLSNVMSSRAAKRH
jgi:enoyl-CoA hydratase/carnithine racemase